MLTLRRALASFMRKFSSIVWQRNNVKCSSILAKLGLWNILSSCFATQISTDFGVTTSSICESAHNAFKNYNPSAKNTDMLAHFQATHRFQAHQLMEIHAAQSIIGSHPDIRSRRILDDVAHMVNLYALLYLVCPQIAMAEEAFIKGLPLGLCRGIFRRIYGIPCKHDVYDLMSDNRKITLDMIHEQWHIDNFEGISYCKSSRVPTNAAALNTASIAINEPPPKRKSQKRKAVSLESIAN